MLCQHVMAPVTGTGPPQAAETAWTARASPRLEPTWQALSRHVMGTSVRCTLALGGDGRGRPVAEDACSLRGAALMAITPLSDGPVTGQGQVASS
jgi:hypothetical protein